MAINISLLPLRLIKTKATAIAPTASRVVKTKRHFKTKPRLKAKATRQPKAELSDRAKRNLKARAMTKPPQERFAYRALPQWAFKWKPMDTISACRAANEIRGTHITDEARFLVNQAHVDGVSIPDAAHEILMSTETEVWLCANVMLPGRRKPDAKALKGIARAKAFREDVSAEMYRVESRHCARVRLMNTLMQLVQMRVNATARAKAHVTDE